MPNRLFCLLMQFTLLFSCRPQPTEPASVGVVSTASPEATTAGKRILEKGGNAADAAVAIAFTLGVTEPAMSGLGGGMQILLALPGQVPLAINGASISPAATPTDIAKKDLSYLTRSTIPSTVKVLHYTWQKYGSGRISWAELLAPAIAYAENGFAVGMFRHKVYKKYEKSLTASPHHTHFWLMPNKQIPGPGDTLRQPHLAHTLRRLAEHGAADFYEGVIADHIAADMQHKQAWISKEDLISFPNPSELAPVHTTYRGYDIYSQPPPCGGWTALLALNILEQFPAENLQMNQPGRCEKVLQALHLAHQDRKNNPITDLNHYQEAVTQKLDKAYARHLLQQYQSPATTWATETDGGETTHYAVVDRDGMGLAVTASINAYFGAAAASAELGFLYNTYMDDFVFDQPDHPYAIGPGKMNYSSMSPTIVQKEGKTVLIIGSPGSARIISAVAQLTQLWIDSEMDLQEIVYAPRMHAVDGKVYLEDARHTAACRAWARQEGFVLAFPTYDLVNSAWNAYYGGVHAIGRRNQQWAGAADPRRDGTVAYVR